MSTFLRQNKVHEFMRDDDGGGNQGVETGVILGGGEICEKFEWISRIGR